jgi:DNA-binding CsgD family transcriptional regulator
MTALLLPTDRDGSRAVAEGILGGEVGPSDDLALAEALAVLGWLAWDEGRVQDALGLLRAAVQRAGRARDATGHPFPRFGRAVVWAAVGELAEAASAVAEDAWDIERSHDREWSAAPEVLRSVIELAAGRPASAMALAEAGRASAEEAGNRVLVAPAMIVCAAAALSRGDVAEARRMVDACHREPDHGHVAFGVFGAATYLWIEARVAEAECGVERAVHLLRDVYDDPTAHRRLFVEQPGAAAWLVRAARKMEQATGAAEYGRGAEAVVACVELLAAENRSFASVRASALHARGVLVGDCAALAAAAENHCQPWAAASALEDLGVALLDAGEPVDSHHHLERALAAYTGAAAPRDAARVRNRIGRLVSQRPGGKRQQVARPLSGWGSLTETERRVAHVVAEGLTNAAAGDKLFLSRHTVDFHLRQIFRKLAIRSRVELTRLALEHQRTTTPPRAMDAAR